MKTNITIELNPINCGIYEFRHIETGLAYVGSAIDVRTRIAQHFKDLSRGRHHNRKAQVLYDQSPSGNSAFTVALIESCTVDEMDDIETGYIQTGEYGLNTATGKFGRKARGSEPALRKAKRCLVPDRVVGAPKKRGPKAVIRTPEERREVERLRKAAQRKKKRESQP